MKVFVTGHKGMLGTDLMNLLAEEKHDPTGADIDTLDICDLEAVMEAVGETKPDAVVNCAAYTNVDACETDADNAYRINAIGPKNLAIASNHYAVPLVHISTDYVFDGESDRPYLEGDFPNPQSVYGKSKLFGEENVRSLANRYFIFRTQWLYGKNGKNFVKTMLALAETSEYLTVVDDQSGSPTYTKDLAKVIVQLIGTRAYGTYHATNAGICTWHAFTKQIMELAGVDIEVRPCTTAEFPRPAKRPRYAPLENFNLKLCGFATPRPWQEALKDYLREEGR